MLLMKKIQRVATIRNILVMLAITIIVGAIMMAVIQPQLLALSGGLQILDIRFGYTYQDALDLLTALGEEGRQLYSIQQVVDTVFPLAYGLTLLLALGHLTARLFPGKRECGAVVSLGLVGAIFDYGENMLIGTQLASFPNVSAVVIEAANLMTMAKWLVLLAAFLALITMAVMTLVKRLRR